MATFSITSTTTKLDLDGNRQGSASFAVTNTSGQNLRGRGRIKTDDGAKPDWFTIAEPVERDFPVDGTEQYSVAAKIPAAAPPGDHRFRLDMVGVANPDEQAAEGAWIAFTVPATKAKPFPWIWLIIPIAIVLLAAGGFAAWYFFLRGGESGAVEITAGKGPLDFGTVAVNASSSPKSITLKNTGGKSVNLTVTLGGANADQFQVTNNCGSGSLAPKATCDLSLTFKPKAQGQQAAKVQFQVDTGSAPDSVSLTGTGQGVSSLCFNPNPLDLSFRYLLTQNPPPTSGTPQAVTVTNCGSAALTIQTVILSGDFHFQKVDDQCSGRTFQPNQSCTVTVRFITSDNNRYAAQLTVTDTAPGSPHILPVTGQRSPRIFVTLIPIKT